MNKDGLAPINNISFLRDTKVFIGHGRKDVCIHYSKSVAYYEKIIQEFPIRKNQFMLKLYSESGHDSSTSKRAVEDFLEWIKVEKK